MTRPDRSHADASAFCAAEWPQLVRALSLYVGDPYVAEELAQEALLRACRQWATVSQLKVRDVCQDIINGRSLPSL